MAESCVHEEMTLGEWRALLRARPATAWAVFIQSATVAARKWRDGEDITQEVARRLLETNSGIRIIGSGQARVPFLAWLRRILRLVSLEFERARRRRGRAERVLGFHHIDDPRNPHADIALERKHEQEAARNRLVDAMLRLPQPHTTIMRLHMRPNGATHAEVAAYIQQAATVSLRLERETFQMARLVFAGGDPSERWPRRFSRNILRFPPPPPRRAAIGD